jgi:hypothetical protein
VRRYVCTPFYVLIFVAVWNFIVAKEWSAINELMAAEELLIRNEDENQARAAHDGSSICELSKFRDADPANAKASIADAMWRDYSRRM